MAKKRVCGVTKPVDEGMAEHVCRPKGHKGRHYCTLPANASLPCGYRWKGKSKARLVKETEGTALVRYAIF